MKRTPGERCVRLATAEDAEAIGDLLVSEYLSSPDFRIADPAFLAELRASAVADPRWVLTAWERGELLATMRAELLFGPEDAVHRFCGARIPELHAEWPAPVLVRAATRASHRRSGLNSLLRLHLLRAALDGGARRLYGYVAVGGARTRLMASLGYEFAVREDGDPFTPAPDRWAVAWLDLPAKGRRAAALLEERVRDELEQFPWSGPRLEPIRARPGGSRVRSRMG